MVNLRNTPIRPGARIWMGVETARPPVLVWYVVDPPSEQMDRACSPIRQWIGRDSRVDGFTYACSMTGPTRVG